MKIRESVVDGVTVLAVQGRVVLPDEVELLDSVRTAVDRGAREILIDLRRVRVMDSSGVGALVAAYTSATNARAGVRLCCLSDRLLDLIHTVQLHTVFEILATREEGLETFRQERRGIALSA